MSHKFVLSLTCCVMTPIFKLQIMFYHVKNTTLELGLEPETINTGAPRLNDCASSAGLLAYALYPYNIISYSCSKANA